MAVIGRLSVVLGLNSAKFTKALHRAQRRVAAFGDRIATQVTRLAKYGAALTAAGVAAGTLLVRSSLQAMDATAKLADRIGTTTEALSGLQFAAQQTGADNETLGKSLQFMAKSLGEASTGVGEAKDALALLGLDTNKLIRMDPAEAFRAIADRMANVSTQSEKAFIATRLFGRSGMALVNTLSLGSQGLDEMAKDAEKLGIVFDRTMGAKAEIANDAMNRLRLVFVGLGNQLAVRLAPFITAVSNKLVEMSTRGDGLGKTIVNAMEKVVSAIAQVVDTIQVVRFGVAKAELAFVNLGITVTGVYKKIADAASTLPGGAGRLAAKGSTIFGQMIETGKEERAHLKTELVKIFNEKSASDKVKDFFSSIRDEMDKQAEKIAQAGQKKPKGAIGTWLEGVIGNLPNTLKQIESFGKQAAYKGKLLGKVLAGFWKPTGVEQGGFEQIIRSRTALGTQGPSKKRIPIEGDPQQTALLQQLVTAFMGGGGMVARATT